jgi:hypothetical protein
MGDIVFSEPSRVVATVEFVSESDQIGDQLTIAIGENNRQRELIERGSLSQTCVHAQKLCVSKSFCQCFQMAMK